MIVAAAARYNGRCSFGSSGAGSLPNSSASTQAFMARKCRAAIRMTITPIVVAASAKILGTSACPWVVERPSKMAKLPNPAAISVNPCWSISSKARSTRSRVRIQPW